MSQDNQEQHQHQHQSQEQQQSLGDLIKALGPGILMASAAIGGSHLVSSTQAGALYGWGLALFCLLVNFLKYPFFRIGTTYTIATGENIISGYYRLGRWAVILLWAMMIFSGITCTAAVCAFSGALMQYFLPFKVESSMMNIAIMAVTFMVLAFGHFRLMTNISKILITLLTVFTVGATILAAMNGPVAPADFVPPSPWTLASLGFIVMFMGWMPSPLDVTFLTSAWTMSQKKHMTVTKRSALFDFNVGFVVTALLAVVFIALGALMMCGSGKTFSMNGGAFTSQFIALYADTFGPWSKYFIAFIAFACIWGTTLTVMDGYARAATVAQERLWPDLKPTYHTTHIFWMAVTAFAGLLLCNSFKNEMLMLLKFAMICSFVTTPIFAFLHFRLMMSPSIPKDQRLSPLMQIWCWAGIIFLFGFLGLFLWFQFLR